MTGKIIWNLERNTHYILKSTTNKFKWELYHQNIKILIHVISLEHYYKVMLTSVLITCLKFYKSAHLKFYKSAHFTLFKE